MQYRAEHFKPVSQPDLCFADGKHFAHRIQFANLSVQGRTMPRDGRSDKGLSAVCLATSAELAAYELMIERERR